MKPNSTTLFSAALLLSGLVGLVGCGRQAVQKPNAVAQVGDTLIELTALQAKLERWQAEHPGETASDVDKLKLLQEQIQFEAAYQQARRAGWHTNRELVGAFKQMVVDKYKEKQLALSAPGEPTEREISGFYESNPARFGTPAMLRAAVIRINVASKTTPEKRAEVRARAEAIRTEAERDAAKQPGFGVLAQQYSDDQASRYQGGDLGFQTPSELEHRLGVEPAKALFALREPGEMTAVIEGPGSLCLLKLMARQPESRRPLAQVREGIAYLVRKSKVARTEHEFSTACTNGMEIRINRALFESLSVPPRPASPPRLPGTQTAQAGSF